ncbi:hypothetical protein CDEST_06831 [Colletotrichum destructivum]|uniref:Uncharacterized protein n=1 Tax=Colletotrichum destructivum TaxID=34406 RepID=A0AAX4IEW0_9PEZI|nr:hypothetical protein CDEST_06831 [Colletotrichum destructivum]
MTPSRAPSKPAIQPSARSWPLIQLAVLKHHAARRRALDGTPLARLPARGAEGGNLRRVGSARLAKRSDGKQTHSTESEAFHSGPRTRDQEQMFVVSSQISRAECDESSSMESTESRSSMAVRRTCGVRVSTSCGHAGLCRSPPPPPGLRTHGRLPEPQRPLLSILHVRVPRGR